MSADAEAILALRISSDTLWDRWSDGDDPHAFKGVTWGADGQNVTELDFSGCAELADLSGPELARLTSLKSLGLGLCSNLTSLPPDIGALSKLEVLDLSYCTRLQALPEGIPHKMIGILVSPFC